VADGDEHWARLLSKQPLERGEVNVAVVSLRYDLHPGASPLGDLPARHGIAAGLPTQTRGIEGVRTGVSATWT